MKQRIFLISILVILVNSCKKPNQEKLNSLVERGTFEQSELVKTIEVKLSDTAYVKQLRFADTLIHYYQNNDFKPVWSLYMVDDSMAQPILDWFYDCREEGFKPSYYKLDKIQTILQELKSGKIDSLYGTLADLELLVSDNMLSLHRDRVYGRTDPQVALKGAYHLPRRTYEDFDLLDVLDYKDYKEVLNDASIKDTAYVYLKDMLKQYLVRMDSGEKWSLIDTVGVRKLEPGDTTELMPAIALKLNQIQVISAEEAKDANPTMYNKDFAKYVRRFQQRYGLYDDAIFGRNTFGLLNESIKDRIDQIAANMERIRWFKEPEETPYVTVNIPAFELTLHYEDSVQTMAVCVGKPRKYDYDEKLEKAEKEGKYWLKPSDHETPQIYSKIAYMVVNPTWNVPRSIITREMWWKMKTDSHYLANAGYGVFYKKREVRSDTINWRKYTPSKIPFEIIQKSGDDNALGRVKFIFPNRYSIYLHDTPQKSKFRWTGRAVSHGCVRVEDPVLLGEFVSLGVDTMDSDDFRVHMGYEPRDSVRLEEYDPLDSTARIQPIEDTRIIRLNKQMPVFFLYNTIWFDKEWKPQYRNDVYDKNKLIIAAMSF